MEYFKKGNAVALVELLESSRINANKNYRNSMKDQSKSLNMLAAYYTQTAYRERNKSKRDHLFSKASDLYMKVGKDDTYDLVRIKLFLIIFF